MLFAFMGQTLTDEKLHVLLVVRVRGRRVGGQGGQLREWQVARWDPVIPPLFPGNQDQKPDNSSWYPTVGSSFTRGRIVNFSKGAFKL